MANMKLGKLAISDPKSNVPGMKAKLGKSAKSGPKSSVPGIKAKKAAGKASSQISRPHKDIPKKEQKTSSIGQRSSKDKSKRGILLEKKSQPGGGLRKTQLEKGSSTQGKKDRLLSSLSKSTDEETRPSNEACYFYIGKAPPGECSSGTISSPKSDKGSKPQKSRRGVGVLPKGGSIISDASIRPTTSQAEHIAAARRAPSEPPVQFAAKPRIPSDGKVVGVSVCVLLIAVAMIIVGVYLYTDK